VNEQVIDAVRAIAGNCDGAVERDYVGFDGTDTHFGRALAALPDNEWTGAMIYDAWIMLRKYKEQLRRDHNIDYDSISTPTSFSESGRRQARLALRAIQARRARKVTFVNGNYAVVFPYDQTIVDEIKLIESQHRQWDNANKLWHISLAASKHLYHIATEYGFSIADDALEELTKERTLAEEAAVEHIQQVMPTGRLEISYDSFIIKFSYNKQIMQDLKDSVPGRRWNPEVRCWNAPLSSAEEVYSFTVRWNFEMDKDLREGLSKSAKESQEMRKASRASEDKIHIPNLNGTLRPFQAAGVKYVIKARRCMIADQMGLGKTVEALAAIEHEEAYPALVICPATIKLQWEKEVNKWLPHRTVIVIDGKYDGEGIIGFLSEKGNNRPEFDYADIYIINYDIIAPVGKELFCWGDAMLVDNDFKPKALILDESHFIKNPKAKRTKKALQIANIIQDDGLIIPMTGTPVLNRPIELPTQLKAMRRLEEFGGYQKFRSRYCWDDEKFAYVGARNLDELNKKLRSSCYIRRTKDQVMKELPDKARYFLHMEGTPKAMERYRTAETDFRAYLKAEAMAMAEAEGIDVRTVVNLGAWRKKEAEHLTRIGVLRQLSAKAKIEASVEWIKEMIDSDNKVVVFAHHRKIVETLAKKFNAPFIIGGSTGKDKMQAVEAFRGNSPVIILSIKAAGMGLDGLQVARDVLFIEQDWTPAVLEQAEDRLHRMGQENAVSAWYACIAGTIDDYIFAMLKEKRAVVDGVTEGIEVESARSIVNSMLMETLEEDVA
jgi:SNF2 family DNA or RNA helicase